MSSPTSDGFIRALQAAGVSHAFGLPGSQNIGVFEALRKSSIRTVVASHELAAAMMANGYHRASGKVALLATIPGPGFTYALTGLAEARLDSVALLHLTSAPASGPGDAYQLQAIDQAAIVGPLVKQVLTLSPDDDAAAVARTALASATGGEPGPVVVQMSGDATGPATSRSGRGNAVDEASLLSAVEEAAGRLRRASRRVVLLAGQGAIDAAPALTRLVERIGAAVVTTTSGRGVIAEDHHLSLGFELAGTRAEPLNDLIEASDLVLAIGCKFSHNGSRGFALRIPESRLVHVDASPTVIGANYPPSLGVTADAGAFLQQLLPRVDESAGWPESELDHWRERGIKASWPDKPEARMAGNRPAGELIRSLRAALPQDTILVTDSGQHQMLVRRHYRVLSPRGLIVPTNLQSMGFAIPAAIGAKLAAPARQVVAVVGDGGLLMSGLELLTAVKAEVPLHVVVINDGSYGMIKQAQLAAYGTAPSSDLVNPDFERLAGALGVQFARVGSDLETDLATALALPGPALIEVPVDDAPKMRIVRAKGVAKRVLGSWLRRWFR